MASMPVLSIYITTYGHEKYIKQALDSVLMQKLSYSYEVLVGEDASPDGTRAILQQYEADYPGVFTMFYREKNMRNMPIGNGLDLKLRCNGKYIICLEGDDFWTDENKLQEQIDFLETHPDYIAVAHRCDVVDGDSNQINAIYPECTHEEYTLWDYMMGIVPGQTATVMYRNIYKMQNVDISLFKKKLSPADRVLYFMLPIYGKVYCIQKKMSAYRFITVGGASFSANYKYDFNRSEHWHHEIMDYAREHSLKAQLTAETLYLDTIFRALKRKAIQKNEAHRLIKNIEHKIMAFVLYILRYIKRHSLPRTL